MAPIRLLFLQGTLIVRSECILPQMARYMHEGNTMKLAANLLKISLLVALLPASASALTITISAPNDTATTLDVTMTGSLASSGGVTRLTWDDVGDYVTDQGPNVEGFNISGSITASGILVDEIWFDEDGPDPKTNDDFRIYFSSSLPSGSLNFSGSGAVSLFGEDLYNFGYYNIGTYSLVSNRENVVTDSGHSLVIQYSSVPDTGSTAALLGAGVAALAFARRRLG